MKKIKKMKPRMDAEWGRLVNLWVKIAEHQSLDRADYEWIDQLFGQIVAGQDVRERFLSKVKYPPRVPSDWFFWIGLDAANTREGMNDAGSAYEAVAERWGLDRDSVETYAKEQKANLKSMEPQYKNPQFANVIAFHRKRLLAERNSM